MRCPYCQSPLTASAPECPKCRLSYPKTGPLLGAVPRLAPLIADTTGSLKTSEQAKIRSRIIAIHNRFPQLVLQVVMHRFAEGNPFSLHMFWLFNAASFASDSKRGKDNHALLLGIDPARGEAAIMPGYGLEPFLTSEAIDHLLELASPAWQTGRWTDGILRVLEGLEQWLETIALPDPLVTRGDGDY